MKNLEKSLALLKKYFKENSRVEIEATLSQVDLLKGNGPTISEYFSDFKDGFQLECIIKDTIKSTENTISRVSWKSEYSKTLTGNIPNTKDIDNDCKINKSNISSEYSPSFEGEYPIAA